MTSTYTFFFFLIICSVLLVRFSFITLATPPLSGADTTFYENTVSFSSEALNTTCCLADLSIVNVTCGRGASCAARCCALGATLCPSGVCSEDPDSCQAGLQQEGTARARGEQEDSPEPLKAEDARLCKLF